MMDAIIRQRIELWSTSPRFDEKTRKEAARIGQDSEEAVRCFGSELSFGTGGLRGILGVGTNRMNEYTVARATQGLLQDLLLRGGKSVAISCDSRNGSRLFADVAAGVLAQGGVKAYLYPNIMPTPLLSYAVRELGCDAGIMITASHNPAQYNGYKVYNAAGCQETDEAAQRITDAIEAVAYEDLAWMTPEAAQKAGLYEWIAPSVFDGYLRKTLACRVTAEPVGDLRIVYTPLHGTGLEPVRAVLRATGATAVHEVAEQLAPDGDFPTCPFPNPELPEALALALRDAQSYGADLLLATDPDCDRVGVGARDDQGTITLLTGNEVGVLLTEYLLRSRKAAGRLPENPVVIKTIVTTDLVLPLAKEYGAQVPQTLTGFKYIGELMGLLEREGRGGDFILGFEESVGYLAGMHVRDKDGVMAVMLIADMAREYRKQGLTLWQAMQRLYQRYGTQLSRLLTLEIEDAQPMARMEAIMKALRQHPPTQMAASPVAAVLDYLPGLDGLPESDVLSVTNLRGEKVIVRPSGTEPKVKMYLSAAGGTREEALERLDDLEAEVRTWTK